MCIHADKTPVRHAYIIIYTTSNKRIYTVRYGACVYMHVCTREWTRSVGGCCTRDGVRILYVGAGRGARGPRAMVEEEYCGGF